MIFKTPSCLTMAALSALAVSATPLFALAQESGDPGRDPGVLDEVAAIVGARFYSQERLTQVGWDAALSRARAALARTRDRVERTEIVQALLATLATSHTNLYPRDDPAYWALASIFEPVLMRSCDKARLPNLPITSTDIGVFWKRVAGQWFVGGVYAGGPAERAGLKLGDHVVAADDRPFSPVEAFADKAGKSVKLKIERRRAGVPIPIVVTPRTTKPHEELRQATAESWKLFERRGRRIAYVHVWTWTSLEIQTLVLEAIAKSNAASADGLILDLRDGWGGAATHYLGMFFRDVPVLESVDRAGAKQAFDYQIRRPAVILINGGTRSGKETIAYGIKKHGLARLMGERTAGAVTFGQPFCLADGSLLLLAVADAKVDGERLEGHGVSPDVEVPFDFRFANGADPQLEQALEALSRPAGR